jgi:hypothetical protein
LRVRNFLLLTEAAREVGEATHEWEVIFPCHESSQRLASWLKEQRKPCADYNIAALLNMDMPSKELQQ